MKYTLLAFAILGTVFGAASCIPKLPELPEVPEIPEITAPTIPAPEGVFPSSPVNNGLNIGDTGFKPMCVAGWVEDQPGKGTVDIWDSFTGIQSIEGVSMDLDLDLDPC